MTKKYKVQQYFDTYPEKTWLFDTEAEAVAFYEKKQRELRGRYKTDVSYIGLVGTED